MENEKIICSICGEEITDGDYEVVNGNYYCLDCYNEEYTTCEDCGAIIEKDYAYYIEDGEYWVCDSCIDNYEKCVDCVSYHPTDDMRYIQNYGYVCDDCYDDGEYGYCDDCGDYFRIEELSWSNSDDCYYCRNCRDDHEDTRIYDYHGFNDWQFFKGENEGNPPYYIGKEIELEPRGYDKEQNLTSVMNSMSSNINAVGMHDGSLCGYGVEIVTHPESWKYLQEKKEDYRTFFKDVVNLGYGDNGNSGLHFHVSRPNEDVVSKIIVILESFKDEIKKLSRRNGDNSWSHFLTDNGSKEDTLKYRSTKYLKDKYVKEYHDRYMALNLCNSKTIEFRFFNGANNFEEFWGALQFIHNIMDIALDDTRAINSINWQDLLVGDELREQAKKTGVYEVNKYAKDTTDILEKLEKVKEEMIKDVKKTLKNFIKYITREMETKRLEFINKNDIMMIEQNGQEFLNTLSNDLNYLHRLTNLYYGIDTYTIDDTKYSINNIKHNTRNMDKYSRYFKQIDNTVKKYESEVLE